MDDLIDLQTMRRDAPDAPDAETGVELMRAIVRDKRFPLRLRLDCAKHLLPFEAPKLAVTGVVRDDGFAVQLERAIARSRNGKVLELTANAEGAGEVAVGKAGRRFG
jgi:hypothetical protein